MSRFYVIEGDGNVSWHANEKNPKKDGPEFFDTEAKAVKRAKELAENEPGTEITISKGITIVLCRIGKPELSEF